MLVPFGENRPKPKDVALIFVHGFTGTAAGTWGAIPGLVASSGLMDNWDLWGFGFESKRRFDITRIWSSEAGLEEIATMLVAQLELKPYKRIALVAHSMGGLVAQRALLKNDELALRCSHLLMFATPSNGLGKAGWLAALKQQLRDMNASGAFIQTLRADWKTKGWVENPPFHFLAVAGETDQFVPPDSSLSPFLDKFKAVIPGDHLSILRTDLQTPAPVVETLTQFICAGANPSGARNSAALALESGQFQSTISTLWPIRKELDNSGAALLALALDTLGRREDAIAFLTDRGASDTDCLGILAGRYKRRWLVEHRQTDLDRAFGLYREAYAKAMAQDPCNHSQAYYHGINIAFLGLATGKISESRTVAGEVLKFCANDTTQLPLPSFWRLASEGDALMILGQVEDAMAKHAAASKLSLAPWQALSIQEQAVRTADLCGWTTEQQAQLLSLYSK